MFRYTQARCANTDLQDVGQFWAAIVSNGKVLARVTLTYTFEIHPQPL